MKTMLGVLQVFILASFAMAGLAQDPPQSDGQKIQELVQNLDKGIEEVKALSAQIDAVPEIDREAVVFRRNERGFKLLQELDVVARGVAQLPEDDPQRIEIRQRLLRDFAGVADMVFVRADELSRRIASFTAELESLSGARRIATEAYIDSLETMRIQTYDAITNIIEARIALGLPADDILQKLQGLLYLRAEILVGRIEFSGAAGKELQARLTADPQNAELDATIKAFSNKHQLDLQRLQSISGLLERLGLDNSVYKGVQLQHGQSISVRDIEGAVVMDLLRDSLASLRESLWEQAPDMLLRLFIFILVLLAFRVLSRLTRRAVVAACERSSIDMSTLLKDVLASVSGGTVMILGILMALSQIGISLGPMLAGLGVAGFIVGFALQDTLGNFAAGSMILIYRPYDVDDFVEVTGASGLVKKMSLVSTTITTFDNQTLVVPNSKIWGDVIKNVTAQKVRRVDLEFGIGYSDDIEQAERVLKDILDDHEMVLGKPEPLIKLHTLGDSSVNFVVRPWTRTEDYWTVYWDIMREVKMRFDREGISIPFPQRDVHLYREDA